MLQYCYLTVILRNELASFMCFVDLTHIQISLPFCFQEPLVFMFSFLLTVPPGLRHLSYHNSLYLLSTVLCWYLFRYDRTFIRWQSPSSCTSVALHTRLDCAVCSVQSSHWLMAVTLSSSHRDLWCPLVGHSPHLCLQRTKQACWF